MRGTLTLDLFRPAILDPVEDVQPARDLVVPTWDGDRSRAGGGERRFAYEQASGGGPTLDDLVVGVWEGLAAHRTVACPACGEAMTPRYGAGSAPVGGRCGSCRTTIM